MMTKIDNVHLHSSDLHAFEDAEQARILSHPPQVLHFTLQGVMADRLGWEPG